MLAAGQRRYEQKSLKASHSGDLLPGCAGFFVSRDHLRGAAFLTSNQERWSCDAFFFGVAHN